MLDEDVLPFPGADPKGEGELTPFPDGGPKRELVEGSFVRNGD